MAFTLDTVVPWGRSFSEYQRMFALSDADLEGRIVACADGPAGFNAEATRRGCRVISCDPLYRSSADDIRKRIDRTYPVMLLQTRENREEFLWEEFGSVEDLGEARMRAMETFLEDFDRGREQGRYVDAELPSLPFGPRTFDLAICSHFLFVYTEQRDADFHVEALFEMARVAREVRIFPLVALGGIPSSHLPVGTRALKEAGKNVRVERVAYEFVRGANEMLRIRTEQ